MRTKKDFADLIVYGVPLPFDEALEIPLPEGFYVCMECKEVTDYWEPGMVCAGCEARGERQFEAQHDEG